MGKLVPETHPALHQIAEEVPVEEITSPRIQKILKDMKAALGEYKMDGSVGVAIAAPQIGIPLRIFLVHDMSQEETGEARIPTLTAINPKIIKLSKKKHLLHEGCLSVPLSWGMVKRSERALLRAYNERGKEYEYGASGLLAQIFQHETDHLDGILFIDRAEELVERPTPTASKKSTDR